MFLLSQNDENQSENGSKTQKSASGPGHLRNRKKRCCKPKHWGQKVEKHGFFHFSLADFGRARSRTGVFRTVFYSVFWRRASRPIKNRRFWPKNAPPGKPVTFYECHPDDHAPAPSVRADLCLFQLSIWALRVEWSSRRTPSPVKGVGRAENLERSLQSELRAAEASLQASWGGPNIKTMVKQTVNRHVRMGCSENRLP